MKCQLCKKPAVISSPKLCKEHFIKYYENKVRKFLKKYKIENKKLLVAISGGKDSSSLSYVLHKLKSEFNLTLDLFYIDLGIHYYSTTSKDFVISLSKKIGEKLIIYDLKGNENFVIDDFFYKPCSYCGVVKRYIINRFAYENNYDFVAIGHNIDDELFFVFNNLFNQDINQFFRIGPVLETNKENKLIGRIKPLYYFTEKENMLYALLNDIPFYNGTCPHATNSTQLNFKSKFLFNRDQKLSLIKSFLTIKKCLNLSKKDIELNQCKSCGFPTTSDVCKFCKIKERVINQKTNNKADS